MKDWKRAVVGAVLAGAVFVVNPLFLGCGPTEEEQFEFGEEEMRTAVEGDWVGEVSLDGGEAVAFELTLAQSQGTGEQAQGLEARRQGLCDHRSFVAPAEACMAYTEMPLGGAFEAADGETLGGTVDVEGRFEVHGVRLDNGFLTVSLPDGHELVASYEDGVFIEGKVRAVHGQYREVGTFTLARP